jgi:chromosomal replication initiator protein
MTATTPGARQIWSAVLGELQLQVTRPSYETWLKGTVGIAQLDGEFVVGTPNAFVAEMLEQRMYSLISQTVERITKGTPDIRFQVFLDEVVEDAPTTALPEDTSTGMLSASVPSPSLVAQSSSRLNPKYTFDSFIVGKSNELAHAAAQAVADNPGVIYNPLVMYSDVGLGKTHLLHAIGERVRSNGLSLIYATTEEFTNDYIKAIREGKTEDFRLRYRNADVLLLDDIQFLIGKEQTQEGFFHTFNALHMSNRQIVITSDRPVSSLKALEGRISSRLTGGLVVDIQSPDLETRLAILRAKAEHMRLNIDPAVLDMLGSRVHQNIRELEGSLNRLVAYADLTRRAIDADLVMQVAADTRSQETAHQVSEGAVLDGVSKYYQMDVATLKGRKRDRKTARARQVAMFLLREETNMGATAIGRLLGGKDHSTVLHGCRTIENQQKVDDKLRLDILKVRESLAN